MSRPRTTAGKRNVQQHKREKAQAKQERRASRREAGDTETPAVPVEVSEAELIEELAALHGAAEAGRVTQQEFEERREHIRQQLELVERAGR